MEQKTLPSEPAVLGRTTTARSAGLWSPRDSEVPWCSLSLSQVLHSSKERHPGVGLAYVATWLPLCQVGFQANRRSRQPGGVQASGRSRQVRHTHRAGALTPCTVLFYSVASSLKKQEITGKQMCSWFPQKAPQFCLVSADGEGHLGQDLLSTKPDEAMTDLFLPNKVPDAI